MPNHRAINKVYLGGFVERAFKAEIERAARKAGMADNLFGFAMNIIQAPLGRRLARPKRSQIKPARPKK